MTIRQNGYVCYAFTCDQAECSTETLMSAADPISAALHLEAKGWGFRLAPTGGPALAFCPPHSTAELLEFPKQR